jgi:DNA-directed RNA polymerase subunit RPC12/RpoP
MDHTLSIFVFVWVVSAVVAFAQAPDRRKLEFGALTLFFLGPLGVGFAAVAVPREPAILGRQRLVCSRCMAAQYVDADDEQIDCWRCHQRVEFFYTKSAPRVQTASKAEAAPVTRAAAKKGTVRCFNCQHTQTEPITATAFRCEKCDTKLTRV